MNLAIEYLTRTGLIKNFLQMPCSICLESADRKMVVVLKEIFDRPDFIKVVQWLFADRFVDDWPEKSVFRISTEELFDSEHVVVPFFRPIPYRDEPIPTKYNNYKQPMSSVRLENHVTSMTNSYLHKKKRINWLWSIFRSRYFGLHCGEYDQYRFEEERSYVRQKRSEWSVWEKWRRAMLPEGVAAGELMFQSAYKSKLSLSQSPWTYTFASIS